jgi:hypothetical protein
MKKYVSAIIFCGALWGLEEATLGHLLHITTLNIGWLLWFPLAYFFMSMVYKQTGKLNSILYTSIIVGAIKLVDLFMTTNLVIIVCPALSIVSEGISLFAILRIIDMMKLAQKHKLVEIISTSLLWRAFFLLCLLFIPTWIMASYPYKGISSIFKLLLYEGLINSLFIYGTVILTKKVKEINEKSNTYFKQITDKIIQSKLVKELCYKPVVSLILLVVTLVIQWVL